MFHFENDCQPIPKSSAGPLWPAGVVYFDQLLGAAQMSKTPKLLDSSSYIPTHMTIMSFKFQKNLAGPLKDLLVNVMLKVK